MARRRLGGAAKAVSQLVRPRIHFGGTFETNVGTANNDDVLDRPDVVDAATVTVHPPEHMGDEEFRRWMEGQTTSGGPGRLRAGWNYYGDNRCSFVDVSVTAVEPRGGPTTVSAQSDPLVGAQVRLGPAVMVDLDPKGFANTQIVADSLEVHREGGLRFRGRPGRFHARWLNLSRNLSVQGFAGASAVFHASVPNSELHWDVVDTPALQSFRGDVERGAGVTVRFCLYLLSPGLGDEALAERYRSGDPVANPAVGRVVGTLGVWQPGELASVAMGRLLVASGSTLDGKLPVALGPAVGPVPYDQTTYEQTAGIVEVPLDPALGPVVAAGELVLVTERGGEMLAEAPVMAESDDRCVYLQQGEPATVRFAALARGAPLVEPVRFLVTDEPGTDARRPVVELPETIEVGGRADGVLALRAANPGCTVVRLARSPGARRLDPARDPYVSVRVLPTDDYGHLGDDELTFPLVYQEVLRYYHLLHPAMGQVLDLSDEQVVTAAAETLLRRTEPGDWQRTRYMPRTRDLSAGKRRLLERWCRKVLDP